MTNTRKTSEVAGIDLGTTNTVAACLDDTGRPQTVPNKDGEHKTSSAVLFGRRNPGWRVGTQHENVGARAHLFGIQT